MTQPEPNLAGREATNPGGSSSRLTLRYSSTKLQSYAAQTTLLARRRRFAYMPGDASHSETMLPKSPIHSPTSRLRRNILVVLLPREQATSRQNAHKVDAERLERTVAELLHKSLQQLSLHTDHIIPPIRLVPLIRYSDKQSLQELVTNHTVPDVNLLRGVVHFHEIDDNVDRAFASTNDISHFVSMKVGRRTTAWKSGKNLCSAMIEVPFDDLPALLHDIALDIAMFYSWVPPTISGEIIRKLRFDLSEAKARFAEEHDLSTPFGDLNGTKVRYVSLASLARHNGRVSLQRYEQLWQKFMATQILELQGPRSSLGTAPHEIEQALRRLHPQGGMLAARIIAGRIATLAPGTYILATAGRKPHNQKHKVSAGNLLGGPQWAKSRWKIAAFGEASRFLRYAALGYIVLFKFQVPP